MRELGVFFLFFGCHRFIPLESEIYWLMYPESQAASYPDMYIGVMGHDAKWETLETFTQEDGKGNYYLRC